MSLTLADQLAVKHSTLYALLSLQLAVQGSRSKVNSARMVQFKYQGIDETHSFDIINLNSYDLILGTLWMHQHQVCLGFNPARVMIGSDEPLLLKAGNDTKLIVHTMLLKDKAVDRAREDLRRYANPL